MELALAREAVHDATRRAERAEKLAVWARVEDLGDGGERSKDDDMGFSEDDDDDAELFRDESAEACRELIREHLNQHLTRNPGASFVSWIAALHPENVKVDARLLTDGNEWAKAWDVATAGEPARDSAGRAVLSARR